MEYSAVYDRPAVRMQDLAGHVGGIIRGEEDEAGCYFLRLADPLQRNVAAECLHLLARKGRRDERSPDRARRDAVDPNLLLSQGLRERSGKSDDRPFRRGVIEQLAAAFVGCDGRGLIFSQKLS